MHKFRILGLTIIFVSSGLSASSAPYELCLKPTHQYEDGLAFSNDMQNHPIEKQLESANIKFNAAVKSFREARMCYQQLAEASPDQGKSVIFHNSTKEMARRMGLVHSQYRMLIDTLSFEAMTAMEPAAGAGIEANIEVETKTLAIVDLLRGAYNAMDQSEAMMVSWKNLAKEVD